MTATRQKYRFKSRQEAEQAQAQSERKRHIAECAFNAYLCGRIETTIRHGAFTVRLLHSANRIGWYLLVSQKTSTGVNHQTHDPEIWCPEITGHYRMVTPTETEDYDLRTTADDVWRAYVKALSA